MRAWRLLLLTLSTFAAAEGGYFRLPSIHGDTIVFTAEGDLWKASIAGGDAQRLTSGTGPESHPAISPDGKWVAFTGTYDGPEEAYVMPLAGGMPRRLTGFGDRAEVVGWNGNGEVLAITRYFHGLRKLRLIAISAGSGSHRVIPLEDAGGTAVMDDGSLVFARGDRKTDSVREYRGGNASRLWHYRDGAEALPLTAVDSNNASPLAWKDRIVFTSERGGVTNLWSMDLKGGDLRQHTRHADFEVRSPAISGDRVVYQHGADLRVVDLRSGADRIVPLHLVSDFDQQRERWVKKPLELFTSAALSANGERVAIVARGAAITAGIGSLRRIQVAVPRGARVRSARLMADGKSILAITDISGETELWLFPADGSGPGRQLTRDADATRLDAVPSPDGKWVAYHDRRARLWLLDVASGKSRLAEQAVGYRGRSYENIVWARDSSAFAVETASGQGDSKQLALFRVSDTKRFDVATARYPSFSVSFSPDGKWLWFLADRQYDSVVRSPWGDRNTGPFFDKRTRIYALSLQPGNRSPFQPRDELEALKPEPEKRDETKPAPVRVEPPRTEPARTDAPKTEPRTEPPKPEPARPETPPPEVPKAATPGRSMEGGQASTPPSAGGDSPPSSPGEPPRPVQAVKVPPIAWEGLEQRLYEVPQPPGNYTALESDGKRLWFLEEETSVEKKGTLKSIPIDNSGAHADVFSAAVRQFAISFDGKKLFFRKWVKEPAPGEMYIVDPTPRQPQELARFQVKVSDWQYAVSPREEWTQIFGDAWRMHRDWFYDQDLHHVDWKKMRVKYGALLPRVTDRGELSDLLAQMSAELSLLHSQVGRGDLRRPDANVMPATLGAEIEKSGGEVRIARIYAADPELVSDLPPLAHAEVGARNGDAIVAIDGHPIRELADVFGALRDTAGKQVLIELRTGGRPPRKAIVIPGDASREFELKRRDYEWRKRAVVERASKGRFGYLYLRAMGAADLASFTREFYPLVKREGLIIDVRGNFGGNIDSMLIEKLMRRPWAYWRGNTGATRWNMQNAFRGPIVVLIDELTYSDGETFSEGMRRLGLGTLVGKRTSGAGVWLSDSNVLLDGGIARAAEWGQIGLEGVWLVEGVGVKPDIEVENPPHATFMGADAQLEAAIHVLEEKVKANPVGEPKMPDYPRIRR